MNKIRICQMIIILYIMLVCQNKCTKNSGLVLEISN